MTATIQTNSRMAAPRWFGGAAAQWQAPYVIWVFELPRADRYKEFLAETIAPALEGLQTRARRRLGFDYGGHPNCFFLYVPCPSAADYRRIDAHLRERLRAALENETIRSVDPSRLPPQIYSGARAGMLQRYKGQRGLRIYGAFRALDCALILDLLRSRPQEWTHWRTEALVEIVYLQDALKVAPSRRVKNIETWLRFLRSISESPHQKGKVDAMLAAVSSELRQSGATKKMLADLRCGGWIRHSGSRRQAFERYWLPLRSIGTRISRLPALTNAQRDLMIHHSYIHSHLLASHVTNFNEKILYSCLLK